MTTLRTTRGHKPVPTAMPTVATGEHSDNAHPAVPTPGRGTVPTPRPVSTSRSAHGPAPTAMPIRTVVEIDVLYGAVGALSVLLVVSLVAGHRRKAGA